MIKNKNFVITEQNVESYAQKFAEWIKTKVQNAHQKGVVLGMSGGVDCSVIARLCQIANVPVHLIMMPYGDNMEKSGSMARSMEFINKFGFGEYHVYDIKPSVDAAMIPDGSPLLEGCAPNDIALARANLRPRERTKYSYHYAQLHRRLVIGTTNLVEFTLGYFTKWGDVADLCPPLLLTKNEMHVLARFLQVPDSIINEKPSAELWIGQTDEDELGMTYPQADSYILTGTSNSAKIDALIERKILFSGHKRDATPFFKE